MPKTAEPGIRYRFSVPEQDTAVHEWIKNQLNMSMSLRMLIKDDINRNGYSDLTCRVNREIPKTSDVAVVSDVPPAVVQPSIFQTKPVGFTMEKKEPAGKNDSEIPFQSVERPVLSAAAMGLLDD